MSRIPRGFRANRAKGISALIQFEFSDTDDWLLDIQNQECSVKQGSSEKAIMTVKTSSDIWKQILLGEMDAMQAMMAEKVEISTDDMDLLMRFARMFKFSAEILI